MNQIRSERSWFGQSSVCWCVCLWSLLLLSTNNAVEKVTKGRHSVIGHCSVFGDHAGFSSCLASCPGVDWECSVAGGYTNGNANAVGAQPWEQCGGEGWKGAIGCVQYPCQPRSQWYSQCRPDCPVGWMCSNLVTTPAPSTVAPSTPAATTPAGEDEILDEEVTDEDLEDLELYDPDDYLDEETETDDFPDPAEHNLDEIQQKDEELNGEFEAEDATLTRRRRNTGNIDVLDIDFE